MKASIIISIYNRTYYLENLLANIRATYPYVEIIIVDDGSTWEKIDTIKKLSKKYYAKLIRHEENLGISASRNDAIRKEASGEILIFLDDDILPTGNWLDVFTRQIEKGFSIVCGTILPLFENQSPYFYNDALEFILGLNFTSNVLLEGATAIKAEIFNEIGFFNIDFGRKKQDGMSGEGWLFFKKAIEKGFKTDVNKDAVFYHYVSKKKQSLSYFFKRARAEGVSDKKAGKNKSRIFVLIKKSIQAFFWALTNIVISIIYISGFIFKKR